MLTSRVVPLYSLAVAKVLGFDCDPSKPLALLSIEEVQVYYFTGTLLKHVHVQKAFSLLIMKMPRLLTFDNISHYQFNNTCNVKFTLISDKLITLTKGLFSYSLKWGSSWEPSVACPVGWGRTDVRHQTAILPKNVPHLQQEGNHFKRPGTEGVNSIKKEKRKKESLHWWVDECVCLGLLWSWDATMPLGYVFWFQREENTVGMFWCEYMRGGSS